MNKMELVQSVADTRHNSNNNLLCVRSNVSKGRTSMRCVARAIPNGDVCDRRRWNNVWTMRDPISSRADWQSIGSRCPLHHSPGDSFICLGGEAVLGGIDPAGALVSDLLTRSTFTLNTLHGGAGQSRSASLLASAPLLRSLIHDERLLRSF